MRVRWATLGVLAWMAAVAVGTAQGASGDEAPVAFADSAALSTSCAELSAGKVRVPIRNETALPQEVSYEVQLTGESGDPVDEADVCGGLKGFRGTATLRPGATSAIELGAEEGADAGSIAGSLVLYAKEGRVARLDVAISKAGPAARELDATPLASSLSENIGTSDHGPIWVPVAGEPPHDAESGKGTKAVTLGVLTGPGDPIAVTYKGETGSINAESSKVGLDLDGDLEPGTYKGKVDLDPKDAEAGTVELELKVSRSWILAALVLIGGIAVGALLLAASGRLIPSARLTGRVGALASRCKAAEGALGQMDGGGKSWNRFGIGNLEALKAPINAKIKEATDKVLIQIEKSVMEGIEAEIRLVEAQIDLLKEVPRHARDLEAALLLQPAVHLPKAREDRPQLERPATEALTGKKIDAEALKPRLDEMDERGKEVKQLRRLERVLERCWIESRKLHGGDTSALKKLAHNLGTCQDSLWEAGDASELDEVNGSLQEARRELADIWPKEPPLDVLASQALAIGAGNEFFEEISADAVSTQPQGLPEPGEELLPPSPPPSTLPPPAEETGDALAKAWRAQLAIVAVSALLAVIGGLGALYVGKTWGTCWDFIAAFTWGLGGQALVSTVGSSLDGLTSLNWLRRS